MSTSPLRGRFRLPGLAAGRPKATRRRRDAAPHRTVTTSVTEQFGHGYAHAVQDEIVSDWLTGGQLHVPPDGGLHRLPDREAAALLAQHVEDGTGHCRVCSSGAQSGRSRGPCTTTHRFAAKAAICEVERRCDRFRRRST